MIRYRHLSGAFLRTEKCFLPRSSAFVLATSSKLPHVTREHEVFDVDGAFSDAELTLTELIGFSAQGIYLT